MSRTSFAFVRCLFYTAGCRPPIVFFFPQRANNCSCHDISLHVFGRAAPYIWEAPWEILKILFGLHLSELAITARKPFLYDADVMGVNIPFGCFLDFSLFKNLKFVKKICCTRCRPEKTFPFVCRQIVCWLAYFYMPKSELEDRKF